VGRRRQITDPRTPDNQETKGKAKSRLTGEVRSRKSVVSSERLSTGI